MKGFVPTLEFKVRGVRNRYWKPGIGAPLADAHAPLESSVSRQHSRIPPRLKIPVTVMLRLVDPRGALRSGKLRGSLELYKADSARSLKVNGSSVPIEFESTSWLAYTLEGAPVWTSKSPGSIFVKPLPFVRRVVFIATPHRGSYQAAGFLGRFAAWLVRHLLHLQNSAVTL